MAAGSVFLYFLVVLLLVDQSVSRVSKIIFFYLKTIYKLNLLLNEFLKMTEKQLAAAVKLVRNMCLSKEKAKLGKSVIFF